MFNQDGAISSLSGKPLKFVNQFKYFGSSISSIENDVNVCIAKAWTVIDWILTAWKSDLSDEIKQEFF